MGTSSSKKFYLCIYSGYIFDMDSIDKRFYRIREVAEILGLPLSTLRFWETKFTVVKPQRNERGTRLYTPRDLDTIAMIQYLVKERGLKLEAAEDLIRRNPEGISRKSRAIQRLRAIRNELKQMSDALGRRSAM